MFTNSIITNWINWHKVLLPINHKSYNFREKKNGKVIKERENLHSKTDKGVRRLWLVDLNHNFECDWLIELFDNKLSDNRLSDNRLSDNRLSDNNLASELVENRSFLKPSTIEEIVIFMISWIIHAVWLVLT